MKTETKAETKRRLKKASKSATNGIRAKQRLYINPKTGRKRYLRAQIGRRAEGLNGK